ncbi:MAG: DUF2306 domain-containing protein [Terracoccus sp.]
MSRTRSSWVPVGLVALALVPVLAGAARLVQVLGGPPVIPADPRFTTTPVPVVLHVAAVIGYTLIGAFQFSATLRARHPGWHRRAGRVTVGLGLVVALSALWLTVVLPRKVGTGDVLHTARLVVGTAMAASLVLGLRAIRRRDVTRHRAWMLRAYALGVGAGTQTLTVGVGSALFGRGVIRTDLMLVAGWVVNLAVAETLIRRRRRHRVPGNPRHPFPVGA